ncbi:type I phosphomannose isomerase catalytic subunit [Flavobacterium gelidilacus]|uniref:type I phosphomannose isomerase catalytic subunit n=1 Tax=Flavobacterium gelidilacus TaxID=206041 RepID=UPI000405E487|nr:type I phosphomannose isomerase catalytic subunit [Flavobacterium gelidilacus]
MKLYPLTFEPILKERIWGGTKLKTYLNKPISSDITGESWELSTVTNDISVVNNGFLKGKNVNQLIELYPNEFLGAEVLARFGTEFPLLFKFIDAKQDLSIQLHPNDELAKKRHNSFGKTEMWYVMQADENARLIVGFKENSNPEEYKKALENKNLVTILNEVEVKAGDVFFLETGTIHAIGAGIVIAEIQQTSDVTYRVYDFDRVDVNGNQRELHTELALDALNYNTTEAHVQYDSKINKSNKVVDCKYFKTNIIPLEEIYIWKKTKEAFTVLMCTQGEFELEYNTTISKYKKGDTVLIPAILDEVLLRGNATLLEISI